MDSTQYDHETRQVARRLPLGPRLAVIGSASFWGADSREICESAGVHLAALEGLVLLTGGVPGVGEAVGRSFVETRCRLSGETSACHILPRGSESWDYGITIFAGSSMLDRREILGRLARVYLAVEGGPGTVHEAEVVQASGAAIVPIGRTGGFAQEIYSTLKCPEAGIQSEWDILGDNTSGVDQVGASVRRIVEVLLGLGS